MESQYTKAMIRMCPNSDELQFYLSAAFDHFANDLNKPFDFIDIALRNNPIPLNFKGNILKLSIAIKDMPEKPPIPTIFKALSPFVASCIMLDVTRQRRLGQSPSLESAVTRMLFVLALT